MAADNLEIWFNIYEPKWSYRVIPNPDVSQGYNGGAYIQFHDENGMSQDMFITPESLPALAEALTKAAESMKG